MMKKEKGSAVSGLDPVEYKPSVYIDFDDEEEMAEFLEEGVGNTVTIVLKGKLLSYTARDGGGNSIQIQDYEVEKIDNDMFSQLADD